MRLFHLLWLLILLLNSDSSLQQNEIKCTVPLIENGYVPDRDIREYKEHDVLQLMCNDRYKPTEDRPSKCTKVGIRAEWTPIPACEPMKCRLELMPGEGTRYESVSRNVFLSGETLRVICGEKYKISNNQESAVTTCNEDGEWTIRPVCTEVVCSNRKPQHVYYWGIPYWRNQPYKMGETINYRCETGFKSTDDATLATCTRDGWTPNPLCQEITCDRKDIQEADVIGEYKQRYRYNEQVRYVCREGYQGQFTLTCRENDWIGNPRCTEITCNRKDIPKAEVISEYKQTYRYNEQVGYRCREGYQGGEFTLTCGGDGWIGTPTCRDTCPKPEVPNGFAVGPYNNTIYYRCNEGFKLFTNKGWWAEAKCNDSQLQLCIENAECGETPVIPNGKVVPPRRQSQARITCNTGYSPRVNYLTCRGGKWTSNEISPKDICTLTYQCHDGYDMVGEDTILCNDGKWEKKNIRCTEITCDRKNVPKAEVISEYKQTYRYNEQVRYRCREGYQGGEFTLTCGGDGWIGSPTCREIVGCGSPPPLTDGDIKGTVKTDYSHQESVEFMCQNYYTMEGGPNRTCINGEWIGQMKCLKPCTVDRDLMNRYNIAFRYGHDDKLYSTHNDFITFTCTAGHRPTGSLPMRQQCIDGVVDLPTCQ